jgi:hypothetical protein
MLAMKIVLALIWLGCSAVVIPRLWRSYRRGERSKRFYHQQAWLWCSFLMIFVAGFIPDGHWAHYAAIALEFVCLWGLLRTMWLMWPDIGDTGGYAPPGVRSGGGGNGQR